MIKRKITTLTCSSYGPLEAVLPDEVTNQFGDFHCDCSAHTLEGAARHFHHKQLVGCELFERKEIVQ